MNMHKIYENMPIFMQNIACSLYGVKENRIRFSKKFRLYLTELENSDFNTSAEIYRIKTNRLAAALIFGKVSGIYSRLSTIDDVDIHRNPWLVLDQLPILSKLELSRLDTESFKISKARRVTTSGTTGTALSLWRDHDSTAMQWAVWLRHRARFGIRLGDLSVNFTGKPVVPISQAVPPFWRYNRAQNQYLISMQHINNKNISSVVGFLNSIRPRFYSGYPSIISEIARLANDSGLCLNRASCPAVVFTGAENLLSYQLDAIKSWTLASVTDQYGLTEGNCNFSRCEFGHYHEDYEMCHVELIDKEPLADGSMRGRLIGTAFFNPIMPIIRYDTGDVAIKAPEQYRCECGRESSVIFSVEGRSDDYVLTPDGRRIMRFDYLFKDATETLENQVVQRRMGEVEIVSVPSRTGDLSDFERKVKALFSEYISLDMSIKFNYVDSIARGGNGKFKAVLNQLTER